MNRRGFLGAILATGAAPAIVRVSSLMRVQGIIVPTLGEVVAVNAGNSLLSIDLITKEALRVLEDQMRKSRLISVGGNWVEDARLSIPLHQRRSLISTA